jgi:hypothetical protein
LFLFWDIWYSLRSRKQKPFRINAAELLLLFGCKFIFPGEIFHILLKEIVAKARDAFPELKDFSFHIPFVCNDYDYDLHIRITMISISINGTTADCDKIRKR